MQLMITFMLYKFHFIKKKSKAFDVLVIWKIITQAGSRQITMETNNQKANLMNSPPKRTKERVCPSTFPETLFPHVSL